MHVGFNTNAQPLTPKEWHESVVLSSGARAEFCRRQLAKVRLAQLNNIPFESALQTFMQTGYIISPLTSYQGFTNDNSRYGILIQNIQNALSRYELEVRLAEKMLAEEEVTS